MAHKALIAGLGMVVASLPLSAAASSAPTPSAAPPGTPFTRYCLRVDPLPDSRIPTIQCRTRDDWASLDVNVDEEWAENGVRVIA